MILHVSTGSPWWMHAAAFLALVLHVGGGVVGLLSGTAAIVFRKGGRWHALAGRVFVVSMLVMGVVAAIVAPLVPQRTNTMGGIFTAYLILTAWMTMWRRSGRTGWPEFGATFVGLGTMAGCVWLILIGRHSPDGMIDGQDYHGAYVVLAIACLAVALDARVIVHGGISGVARVARHLWRMCVGLFVATGSFFLGQQQVFPEWMRGSPVWFVPALAPLVVLVFWMVRVRIGSRFRAVASG